MKILTKDSNIQEVFKDLFNRYDRCYLSIPWITGGPQDSMVSLLLSHIDRIDTAYVGLFNGREKVFNSQTIRILSSHPNIKFVRPDNINTVFHSKVYFFVNNHTDWAAVVGSYNYSGQAATNLINISMLVSANDDTGTMYSDLMGYFEELDNTHNGLKLLSESNVKSILRRKENSEFQQTIDFLLSIRLASFDIKSLIKNKCYLRLPCDKDMRCDELADDILRDGPVSKALLKVISTPTIVEDDFMSLAVRCDDNHIRFLEIVRLLALVRPDFFIRIKPNNDSYIKTLSKYKGSIRNPYEYWHCVLAPLHSNNLAANFDAIIKEYTDKYTITGYDTRLFYGILGSFPECIEDAILDECKKNTTTPWKKSSISKNIKKAKTENKKLIQCTRKKNNNNLIFAIIESAGIAVIHDERAMRILTEIFKEGRSYESIGKDIGLSGERVRQIRNKCLKKVHVYFCTCIKEMKKISLNNTNNIDDLLYQLKTCLDSDSFKNDKYVLYAVTSFNKLYENDLLIL